MDELAKRFADLAEKYGPSVVDTALTAVRMEVYSSLVGSIMWLIVAGGAYLLGRYLWFVECEDPTDNEFVHIPGFILFVVSGCCLCGVLWTWIDPWTWIALNHPELWLAKKVLKI